MAMTPSAGVEKTWCSNFSVSCFTPGRLHSCIHILSALFLLLSLFPANPRPHLTHSTFPHQSLVSASPFSPSSHSHQSCVSPSPSSQIFHWCVVLSPQHPHQLPPSLCPPPSRKKSQNRAGQLQPHFAHTTLPHCLFPSSRLSRSCGENHPLPLFSVSIGLLR